VDFEKARFEAYLDATKRLRWFILASVTASALLLCHVYLEQLSQQEAQLQGLIAHRILMRTEETLKNLATTLTAEVQSKRTLDDATKKRLIDYGQWQYAFDVTSNTLKSAKFADRTIPFLGLLIPANDFLPVIGVMLSIFTAAVWLNLRSISFAVAELSDPQILRIARLHFTFTGLWGPGVQNWTAQLVQYCAIWLPLSAFALASLVDVWSMERTQSQLFYGGPAWVATARLTILVGMSVILGVWTILSSRLMAKVDSALV